MTDEERRLLLGSELFEQEKRVQEGISKMLEEDKQRGLPIVLYDIEKKLPYWEYPDGRIVYADQDDLIAEAKELIEEDRSDHERMAE